MFRIQTLEGAYHVIKDVARVMDRENVLFVV